MIPFRSDVAILGVPTTDGRVLAHLHLPFGDDGFVHWPDILLSGIPVGTLDGITIAAQRWAPGALVTITGLIDELTFNRCFEGNTPVRFATVGVKDFTLVEDGHPVVLRNAVLASVVLTPNPAPWSVQGLLVRT